MPPLIPNLQSEKLSELCIDYLFSELTINEQSVSLIPYEFYQFFANPLRLHILYNERTTTKWLISRINKILCELFIKALHISAISLKMWIESKSTICYAKLLWIHCLFRKFTMISLFFVNSSWIHYLFRDFIYCFSNPPWINYLFREYTMNSLSIHYLFRWFIMIPLSFSFIKLHA